MSYRAIDIARSLVKKFRDAGSPVTSMKLQKLLYYAWAEYFKEEKKPLFDDPIYAWKFGPVVKPVYHEYKIFAAMPITNCKDPEKEVDYLTDSFLTKFVKRYQHRTANSLVFSTHKEGTPWSEAYEVGKKDIIIPSSWIVEFECRR